MPFYQEVHVNETGGGVDDKDESQMMITKGGQ
jgi:hypothetical protein